MWSAVCLRLFPCYHDIFKQFPLDFDKTWHTGRPSCFFLDRTGYIFDPNDARLKFSIDKLNRGHGKLLLRNSHQLK